MADVTTYTEGDRTYRVYGLAERASAVSRASAEADELIAARTRSADDALADWEGAHAGEFVDQANGVLGHMAGLKLALWRAAATLSAFPDPPSSGAGTLRFTDSVELGARVAAAGSTGGDDRAAAEVDQLRAYVGLAEGQDTRFASLAATVTLDGCSATVTYDRPFNAAEAGMAGRSGMPMEELEAARVEVTEPIAVESLLPLPDLGGLVPPLTAASGQLNDFTSGVALAFEAAGGDGMLELFETYPELAEILGGGDGPMSGEAALAVVLAEVDRFDVAGEGGDPDGDVSTKDLQAVADDVGAEAHLRAAARYLLANDVLFAAVANVDQAVVIDLQQRDDTISGDDLATFLEQNRHLRVVAMDYDAFDTAKRGGDPDGEVSVGDLEALAEDESAPAEQREAAAYLLEHGVLAQRIALYEAVSANREIGYSPIDFPLTDDASGFTRNGLLGLVVDQQAFGAHDPDAARDFVASLPLVSGGGDGSRGLPITLSSDEGVRALANGALDGTASDLVVQHAVIARLPETTGAVRNQLITASYDLMARRADQLLAGGLPDPQAPGHPGANWLLYAPWASSGVRDVITGDFSAFGIGPSGGQRQAAADGNQWIYEDIGRRYSAFLELYEANPNPTPAQLQTFFDRHFGEGDDRIRAGFAAYAGVLAEPDPARRQALMYQANVLVATHEQAGAQPYLEELGSGVPDSIATNYIDLRIGDRTIDVDEDLSIPGSAQVNNLLLDRSILSLDPGDRSASDLLPMSSVSFSPLAGVERFEPGFPTSIATWADEGGAQEDDPDSLEGSGASSWMDPEERMWAISRLFEQTHTDPSLYETDRIEASFDHVDWLGEGARPDDG